MTYVDDIFGGFKECDDYAMACQFREYLCKTGSALTVKFNPKPEKTPLPARAQVILGRRYDSTTKRINTSEKKVRKYRMRIASALAVDLVSTKELEKLHGCLNYVAAVEPFGRPFLAHLTNAISNADDKKIVSLSELTRLGLRIWDQILHHNKGITFDFILDRLPQHQSDIFVDASTMWGIGGSVPWENWCESGKTL